MIELEGGVMKDSRLASKIESDPRIILVEDNEGNRIVLSECLTSSGYQTLGLADGTSFFQSLKDFQPHLVLLDLKLPGIDGYTLLQQLQQKSDWQHIPVIIISGFALRADRERAMTLGARRYLVKPVSLRSLKQVIQEELDYLNL